MRLLYVTEDVPNRDVVRGDGSSMISYEVLLALPAHWDVTLLSFDAGLDVPSVVRERCDEVVLAPLRRRRGPLPPLLDPGRRARATRTTRRLVAGRSAAHDVTLLHGPSSLGLARSVRGPLVVQTVDPWSQALAARAAQAAGARRAYWSFRSTASAFLERTLPRRARLLTVGAEDARRWSRLLRRPVRPVPNGVDVRTRSQQRDDRAPTLCFVGSLDYAPNVEAAHRLVEDVLPLVRAQVPGVRVVVAGRNPVTEVRRLAGPDVEVHADVADLGQVFDVVDVAVFPDLHGTGVRNTVREALAAGLPVVATPVAARELQPTPACHLAETDQELADAASALLRSPPPRVAGIAVRTWSECASDYAEELVRAVDEGRSPAGRQRRT